MATEIQIPALDFLTRIHNKGRGLHVRAHDNISGSYTVKVGGAVVRTFDNAEDAEHAAIMLTEVLRAIMAGNLQPIEIEEG